MRNPETTRGSSPERGLTTEDLAHPKQDTTAHEDMVPDRPAPAYPGEATAVPGTTEVPSADGPAADLGEEPDAGPAAAAEPGPDDGQPPLIPSGDAESFRDRWQQIQGTFVDDPREAVRTADALVAEVIQSLAATFSDHKQDLESQWSRGQEVQTEELRMALQQYRAFFNQLLHA
ncbi:hypothetical protein ACFU5O_26360 [Streptomyces sp. NPDC057445]|uniref:hypothetical protein n=1 Tax=Streptomyces sp. NPDC057445 TaxID=3346136 RepID=UPI0036A36D4D